MAYEILSLALAGSMLASPCFLSSSGLSCEALEAGLLGELKPLAPAFVEIETEFGINSALYASVVALESGWAESPLSESKNNITSFTSGGELKAYETKEDCLWDMARNLSENYFDPDGLYFNGGSSLEDVCGYYLIGKPDCDMAPDELEQKQYYVGAVTEIYEGIMRRATIIDTGSKVSYNEKEKEAQNWTSTSSEKSSKNEDPSREKPKQNVQSLPEPASNLTKDGSADSHSQETKSSKESAISWGWSSEKRRGNLSGSSKDWIFHREKVCLWGVLY